MKIEIVAVVGKMYKRKVGECVETKKQMHAFAAQPSTDSKYSVLPLTRQLTQANVSHQISFPSSLRLNQS